MVCPEQNKILSINPTTNVVDKRIDVSAKPISIAFGETSVWVLCGKDGKIDRIDPKTDKVTKTIDLGVAGHEGGIAIGDGFVWVTITGFPITRIDPTAETVAQQFWGEGGGAITASAGALWLSTTGRTRHCLAHRPETAPGHTRRIDEILCDSNELLQTSLRVSRRFGPC